MWEWTVITRDRSAADRERLATGWESGEVERHGSCFGRSAIAFSWDRTSAIVLKREDGGLLQLSWLSCLELFSGASHGAANKPRTHNLDVCA